MVGVGWDGCRWIPGVDEDWKIRRWRNEEETQSCKREMLHFVVSPMTLG